VTPVKLHASGHCRKLTPMGEPVLVTRAEGVCEVRFNRPEKRNAITFRMYQQLTRALTEAEADDAVRAVLLSGEGASFCAGNDLQDFLTGPPFSGAHPAMEFLRNLATFGKPLLAAVHGQTVGIGVTMLLHCDLVVAVRSTQLSLPFVALGLVPEAASSLLLPRLVGYQRAAELLLLGQPFDADKAYAAGFVTAIVPEKELLERARAGALAVAALPPAAVRATKALMRGRFINRVSEAMTDEGKVFAERLNSPEAREAMTAFFEKRKPDFSRF